MTKKLFSILLAAIMVLGMIPSVLAAGNTPRTITIYNEEEGHTYEAYQVFKGDLVVEYDKFDLTGYTENPTGTWSNGTTTYTVDGTNLKNAAGEVVAVQYTPAGGTADWYAVDSLGNKTGKKTLTNPEWGANLNPATVVEGETFAEALQTAFATEFAAVTPTAITLTSASTAADVLRALGFVNDGPALADVIAKYVTGTAIATTSTQEGAAGSKYYELSNNALTDGYYFIKDADDSLNNNESYTDYILKVVEDVSVKAKSDTPTVDKKILETRNVADGSYIPLEDEEGNQLYFVTSYYPTQADADAGTNEITDSTADLTGAIAVVDRTAPLTTSTTNANGLANTPAILGDDGNIAALNRVNENTASIGEYVQYEITGTIPNMEGYTKYYYMMSDNLSKGLTPVIDGAGTASATFQNTGATASTMPVTVEIYGADGLLKETITYSEDMTSTGKNYYSNITVNADGSHSMDIIFDNFLQYKGHAGGTVVVRYWALVNNQAIIGNPGNPNEVDLTYSRNPNVQGTPNTDEPNNPKLDTTAVTGTTPKSIVRTYITELELLKKDADTGLPLTGAKFRVTGTRLIPVVTTSEVYVADAAGTWYLLKDGTYTQTAPTIDRYDYDSGTGEVSVVHEGTYKSYADWDGTTVYGYENVPALSYTGGFADEAAAQAALANDIKPGFKKTTTVDIEYRTENVDVEIEVDSEGRLLLGGLGAGDYVLEEIQAPAGYNMLGKKIELQIRFETNDNGTNEPADDKFSAQWHFEGDSTWTTLDAKTDPITVSYDAAEQTIDDNYFQLTVDNKKGATVPETGGIGTVIFYVLGAVLLVGAGVFLIIRRRMAVSKETE